MSTFVRKTAEVQHNTPEQVEEYARTACDIADRIGLDAEDRAALLPTILAQVASKQVFMEPQQVGVLGIVQPDVPVGR